MNAESQSHLKLEGQITEARREVSAESMSMSVSELTNLFREGVLVIRPEFQRLFRWTIDQKSKLIESILLGIPIPSIFIAQTAEGKWELVDGLQRVSTILELQGLLPGPQGQRPCLKLVATEFLPDLDDMTWDGTSGRELSEAQKLDLRLARFDLRVIKRDSDNQAKFDLFQRLNSFGSSLTTQEIRTALIVGKSSDALAFLQELSQLPSFVSTLSLGDRLIDEQFDLELILRLLMLHNRPITGKRGGLGDFPSKLDTWAINFAQDFPKNSDALKRIFVETFDTIQESGQVDIFKKWDSRYMAFRGGFSSTSYEVIAMGVAYHLANGTSYRTDIRDAAQELWSKVIPDELGTTTGLATGDRFAKTVPLGRRLMEGS